MKPHLKLLGLDAVYGLDWETYYDDDYSLRKMATTEYIVDPRFKTQCVSVQRHDWKKPRVMNAAQFKRWAKTVDWKRSGMLAHHCQFDALIASHHFSVKPAFYFDTLSMARPVMPVSVGGSLKAICAAFKREAKKRAGALEDVKGVRDMTPKQYRALAAYAGDDIDDTWFIFHKLLPYIPVDELRLIDLTIKMYAQPTLLVDANMTAAVQSSQIEKKGELLKATKATRESLMSNEQFAELLRKEGVEPPMKISKRTGKVALALSKQDLEFKALLTHKRKRVRELVEARFAHKSTILETRAERMTQRASIGAQPIYLSYWGAKTGRWSGGDSANWQNMTRGSDLRKSIHAPPGHKLVIADLAQIEARMNAWFNGQQDIIAAFADEQDVYSLAASRIYGREINKADHPQERFVGKVAVLALGYGAGAGRFAEMLRIGAFGPPIDITDQLARDIVQAWRSANSFIVAGWRRAENNARSAFTGKQKITDGALTYEGVEGKGFIHMPGGMAIRYDGLGFDDEGMHYISKFRRKKNGETSIERQRLYGGLIVENYTQALARRVIAEHMLQATYEIKKSRLALTTHDEIVLVVPERSANKALETVKRIMSVPPEWAPGLPLAVEAHISTRYDK